MKEKHYFVKNFKDMKKLCNSLNHHKDTLILCGFVNEMKKKDDVITSDMRTLIFKKVSVNHLKDGYETKTYYL